MRLRTLLLSTLVLSGVASALALQGGPSFLSAAAGVSVPSTPYPLPAVTGKAGWPRSCGMRPNFDQLVNSGTVIRDEEHMCAVRNALFPNDKSLPRIDFDANFLILVGGGLLKHESFSITSVERVDASWDSFFFGPEIDPFLAVTTTKLIPGVPPPPMTPSRYALSAVLVPRIYLDDVVFHGEVIPLP